MVQRFYLHGTTPGTHSGGRMGQLRDFYNIINSGVTVTDVVLDGVDMNADSGFGVGAGAYEQFRVSCARLAVLHCRVIAPGYTWLGGATHVVIADCNFYHGAATRAAVGYVEGWGIRNHAGPFVIIDSRIDGTRYHNLRPNSTGGTEELLYCARNTFVARCEGKTAWAWNNLALGDYTAQGAWFIDNDIYGYTAGGCTGQAEISVANVQYSRINDNRFYSSGGTSWTQGVLDGYTAGGGGGGAADHANSGNSFAAWTVDPAWSGPGDPRDVPMIAGFGAVISGVGSCTGWVP